MKLIHFSAFTLGEVEFRPQGEPGPKPRGLWVSDEDDETSWTSWCESENFRLEELEHAHEVQLAADHNVLMLTSPADLDHFTATYGCDLTSGSSHRYVNWPAVALDHAGILITPYQWSRRMTSHTFWYYGWDCASGCIWDPEAIASVTPLLTEAQP